MVAATSLWCRHIPMMPRHPKVSPSEDDMVLSCWYGLWNGSPTWGFYGGSLVTMVRIEACLGLALSTIQGCWRFVSALCALVYMHKINWSSRTEALACHGSLQSDLTLPYLTLPYLTLPYLTVKTYYRLALRPPVGPMLVPDLIVRILKPLGVFSKLQGWVPIFLS